jgi:hypothetical protein
MTSTIKVNNIQNQCGANIINESSNTITIGASGDTVSLASGASQTGFGRSGSVDWQTTKKTANFTATSGEGYFVDTTSSAITVTAPASPSAGDIFAIKDYAGTFETNNVTVGRNSSNFDGVATDPLLATNQLSVAFVYVDGTQGWKSVQSDAGDYGAQYITATGGTVTCCGDYKIHTFTGPGTLCVSCAGNAAGNNQYEYLVVAGGGSGGSENGQSVAGGGGGAGGFRFAAPSLSPLCYPAKPLAGSTITAAAGAIPVTVGAGGSVNPTGTNAGSNSVFSTITSTGGGGGGFTGAPAPLRAGNPGGSGGGASHGESNPGPSGGAGNTPPVSPPQGNNGGGMGPPPAVYLGGGGGGATAVGGQAPNSAAGAGGAGGGVPVGFGSNGVPCGSFRYYAGGGGGGGSTNRPQTGPAAAGGLGGGATGGAGQNPAPAAATANTGGGGGGAGNLFPNPGTPTTGSAGGSGIVVIRYKYQN